MKLIAVGDCVCDTYVEEGVYYPGGQAVNVSVNAKQAGASQSNFLGIFGDDACAEHLQHALNLEGVGMQRCRKAYAPTATPGVRLVNTDRVFERGPRDTAAHLFGLRLAQEDLDFIAQFDVCHTTNEAGLDADLERLHSATSLSYDFSCGHDARTLAKICPYIDIAFFSAADLDLDACESLAYECIQLGCELVILTRGTQGSLAYSADKNVYKQAVVPCEAIDTMGAGDSFAAAFLVRYFDSRDISRALSFAAERAALTCTRHGAFGHPHHI